MIQRLFSNDPATPDEARRLQSLFWRILAVIVFLRAVFIATVPIDLSGDEAYYWDWGRRLALGYFSKPPAIAWIMALAGWLGNDTVFGIRFVANLMTAGSAAFVFLLTRRMYGVRAAFLAGIAFSVTPACAALAFVMTIDAPLVLCWSAALYLSWRMFTDADASPLRTAMLIAVIAFGMLSKQMMMFFPLILLAFAALHAPARPRLREPRFWAVLLLPYAGLAAPLWWNYRHDWITFQHTSHHFESSPVTAAEILARYREFAGAEFGLITPIGYLLVLLIGAIALFIWPRLGPPERFLALFGVPGLLVMHAMPIRQLTYPNWPAVFYVSTLILLAGWAVRAWSTQSRIDALRRLCTPGLILALVMTLLTYAGAYAIALDALSLGDANPIRRAQGWTAAAKAVQEYRDGFEDDIVLVVGHRWIASGMAFYLPDQPRVYQYRPSHHGQIDSQYDVWPDASERLGDNAFIVVGPDFPALPPNVAACFERTERLGVAGAKRGYNRLERLQIYRGIGLKRYPPAPPKDAS